jgi:hypothetical protein
MVPSFNAMLGVYGKNETASDVWSLHRNNKKYLCEHGSLNA